MAKIDLPKRSGKQSKVREKSVKSQGILKWILSGNPDFGDDLICAGVGASICIVEAVFDILTDFAWIKKWGYHEKLTRF